MSMTGVEFPKFHSRTVLELELEYMEGNKRGENLYKKMGFFHVEEHPNAIRLKDGQMLKLILMIKEL